MTERLYYDDSYLTTFDAAVLDISEDGLRVYLDRTAFYPASGGQPNDTGTLAGHRVLDVIDEDNRIAHVLETPLAGKRVRGDVDWTRRFDHMQQHSGQHLLSAIFEERFKLATLSFHLGSETSTIDLDTPALDVGTLEQAELTANEEIFRNRSISVSTEDAVTAQGLRKPSERSGAIRIVTIEGLDRSACGGTHVRATGEIGLLLIRGTEKIRQSTRLEFVCGFRALQSARSGARLLKEQSAAFQDRIAQLEKDRRKLAAEAAGYRGRELSAQTQPGPDGVRRYLCRVDRIDESIRAEAQAFVQAPQSVYLAAAKDAVLLAASPDSGVNAAAALKPLVTKGGGSAAIAQGSVSDVDAAIRALSPL